MCTDLRKHHDSGGYACQVSRRNLELNAPCLTPAVTIGIVVVSCREFAPLMLMISSWEDPRNSRTLCWLRGGRDFRSNIGFRGKPSS